jgi:hypothetical protein
LVKVELMPWKQGDTITAKINGKRVGELDYSDQLRTVLAAMAAQGVPSVVVDGEVRRGDVVARYLVALWSLGTAHPVPAGLGSKGDRDQHSDDDPAPRRARRRRLRPERRVPGGRVTFGTHSGGKFDGQTEGAITLDGSVIGELSAGHDEKWGRIHEDQESGISGRLMVRIYAGTDAAGVTTYTADGVYKDRVLPAELA